MALMPSEFDQSTEFAQPMTAARRIDIKGYNSSSNKFYAPSDGYLFLQAKSSGPAVVSMAGAYMSFGAPASTANSMFIKKNTDVFVASSYASNVDYVFFISLQ